MNYTIEELKSIVAILEAILFNAKIDKRGSLELSSKIFLDGEDLQYIEKWLKFFSSTLKTLEENEK